MGLFGKKDKQKESLANERIIMEQIGDDDEYAAELVDKMQEGYPIVVNFEKLDLMAANKFLAFFTGASYASGGRTLKINETTYLFAREEEFQDGSLREFLDEL